MQNRGHVTPPLYCMELIPYGAAQNVSTLTTLLPFTDIGSENQFATIFLDNQDATNTVDLIVDVSHGGAHANSFRQQRITISPLDEGSIDLEAPNTFTFVRVSAQTASPAFPTVGIKWAIVVQQR